MEDRRSHLLPPRSPSSDHHLYPSLLPLLRHNSAARFFNSLGYGSSGSHSGYSGPSSSLAPTASGSGRVHAGGHHHARSFSELPSLTPSLLQFPPAGNRYGSGSSDFQTPPSPLVPASGSAAGGATSHGRSFSLPSFTFTPSLLQSPAANRRLSSLGSQTPPSPLAPASGSDGGSGGSGSHARSFSEPSLSTLDYLPSSPVASALEFNDLDLDAADDIVSQYVNLDGLCGLTSGDGTGEVNVPLAGSQQWVTTECSQMPSVHSLARELESGREEQLPTPSPGAGAGGSRSRLSRSRSGSMGSAGAAALYELASGMLSEAQMKKVMGDERLAELMLTDPNRVKRLLANRVSAARMADRKAKLRSQLEHRAEMLKMEINTLSKQLMSWQSKVIEIKAKNSEMIIKLQSMEKLAHLRDALNETLSSEIENLKHATNETRDSQMSNGLHKRQFRMVQRPNRTKAA